MELKKREEIVKMLECWSSEYGCTGCLLIDQGCFDCGHIPIEISKSILDLIKELMQEIKDLEEDYERVYEQAEADIHGNMADGGTSCHWCMDKTKADTVRQMQSKLTDMSEFMLRADHNGAMYYVDHAAWVEEIAKELLEEK